VPPAAISGPRHTWLSSLRSASEKEFIETGRKVGLVGF